MQTTAVDMHKNTMHQKSKCYGFSCTHTKKLLRSDFSVL